MNTKDISDMTDKQIVDQIDKIVWTGNVKGEMDDDTVLWQLLRIELQLRLDTYASCLKEVRDELKVERSNHEDHHDTSREFDWCGH